MESDPASLAMLSMEMSSLAELAHWEPVAMLIDALVDALNDVGPITREDVDTCRRWSRRWVRVRPELRRFYAWHCEDLTVSFCLRCLLDGQPTPSGPSRGRLLEAWRTAHTYDPPFPLWSSMPERSP